MTATVKLIHTPSPHVVTVGGRRVAVKPLTIYSLGNSQVHSTVLLPIVTMFTLDAQNLFNLRLKAGTLDRRPPVFPTTQRLTTILPSVSVTLTLLGSTFQLCFYLLRSRFRRLRRWLIRQLGYLGPSFTDRIVNNLEEKPQ